jgi:hypothetical protein
VGKNKNVWVPVVVKACAGLSARRGRGFSTNPTTGVKPAPEGAFIPMLVVVGRNSVRLSNAGVKSTEELGVWLKAALQSTSKGVKKRGRMPWVPRGAKGGEEELIAFKSTSLYHAGMGVGVSFL